MSPRGVVKILQKGGVGIIPTDTIYGIVGSALSRSAVEKIYKLRKRDKKKPFIVLIGSFGDLRKFGVKLSPRLLGFLKNVWPGPVSVILPLGAKRRALSNNLKYLHRGTNSIAFRLPKDRWLRNFLQRTGPLVAPSANLAGKPPARTVAEAKKYFGNKVDFYIDGGRRAGAPSAIVEIKR